MLGCVALPMPAWLTSPDHARESGLAKDTEATCWASHRHSPCPWRQAQGGPGRIGWLGHRLPIVSPWVGPTGPAAGTLASSCPGQQAFVWAAGPRPALRWPRPGSGSGSAACGWVSALSLSRPHGQCLGWEGSGRGEQSRRLETEHPPGAPTVTHDRCGGEREMQTDSVYNANMRRWLPPSTWDLSPTPPGAHFTAFMERGVFKERPGGQRVWEFGGHRCHCHQGKRKEGEADAVAGATEEVRVEFGRKWYLQSRGARTQRA